VVTAHHRKKDVATPHILREILVRPHHHKRDRKIDRKRAASCRARQDAAKFTGLHVAMAGVTY
jgi:hypothetical protein